MTKVVLFDTMYSREGIRMEEGKVQISSLKLVFCLATREILDCDVYFYHSLDKGCFGKFVTDKKITKKETNKIMERMNEIIESDYPIEKLSVNRKDAIKYYYEIGEEEKARTIEYLPYRVITFYKLLNEVN